MLTTSGLKAAPRTIPRLRDTPGTRLHLMVVSTGDRHCAAIDIASGALVRAWSHEPVDQRIRPYDLVEVVVADDPDVVPDPAEPEAVVIDAPPEVVGRLAGRRAHRLIRPLLHPENAPMLGFNGQAVPFWERRADHPSVAIAEPQGVVVVTLEAGGLWCHFAWTGRAQVLACTDPRLAASLQSSGRDFAQMKPQTYVVVALAPPVQGHCQKVVEALVPRR